jgi:hypothetical protein
MHGTADYPRNGVYQDLLNALYGGIDSANAHFTWTPSDGGPTETTALVRNYSAAGLTFPIHVEMVPIQRHALATDYPQTQTALDAGHLNWNTMRHGQATWTPPSGITTDVGAYTVDIVLATDLEPAHQLTSDIRGNARVGERYAMAMLRCFGITNYNPNPTLASVARTSNTVLTLTFNLVNGGTLACPSGVLAPSPIDVSEDGGSTWSNSSFTAALAGSTVTLTRNSGTWAATPNVQVRLFYGYPLNGGLASSAADRVTSYANENTMIDNRLGETRADAAGAGHIADVPISPTFIPLTAV